MEKNDFFRVIYKISKNLKTLKNSVMTNLTNTTDLTLTSLLDDNNSEETFFEVGKYMRNF